MNSHATKNCIKEMVLTETKKKERKKKANKGNPVMIVATLILQVKRNHGGSGGAALNRCICSHQPVLIRMTATLNFNLTIDLIKFYYLSSQT